jgi:uncharacterized membrane protein (DUF106 family)
MLNFLELLNTAVVNAMDYVFGWVLFLPRDLALCTVAVLTAACLSFVRKWTTDQGWLARADADTTRLKELIRDAKKAKDKDAVKRYKESITVIKIKSMKFEGKPLLWSLIPIALLATWAFGRLAYVPPKLNEPVDVKVYVTRSSIGQVLHIAPEDGLDVQNGYVQTAGPDTFPSPANLWERCNAYVCSNLNMVAQPEGVAVWKVAARDSRKHTLRIRYGGKTYAAGFLAGKRQYAPAVTAVANSPVQAIELVMKPMRLFDYIGAIDFLFLPPWLVAYLLIAIPSVSLLRRVFRIY